jgi:hypothetical protein
VIELNLNGCYWMAQSAGRVMQPGSSIVNISSVLALTDCRDAACGVRRQQGGFDRLTRDLAQQWTPRKGIRVNALAPGYFPSEMTGRADSTYFDEVIVPRTLFGRLGRHHEIAAALVFLASEASSYVTGITLPVDGGMLAYMSESTLPFARQTCSSIGQDIATRNRSRHWPLQKHGLAGPPAGRRGDSRRMAVTGPIYTPRGCGVWVTPGGPRGDETGMNQTVEPSRPGNAADGRPAGAADLGPVTGLRRRV